MSIRCPHWCLSADGGMVGADSPEGFESALGSLLLFFRYSLKSDMNTIAPLVVFEPSLPLLRGSALPFLSHRRGRVKPLKEILAMRSLGLRCVTMLRSAFLAMPCYATHCHAMLSWLCDPAHYADVRCRALLAMPRYAVPYSTLLAMRCSTVLCALCGAFLAITLSHSSSPTAPRPPRRTGNIFFPAIQQTS